MTKNRALILPGIVALPLGIAAFVLAWFQSGPAAGQRTRRA